MNKRFAAVLAAMAVAGVTSAFAANPFSDVTPSDWAYQSVAQLAQAGVINGYPDGSFKGQNNITRFEMAQMVAKAMANEARANAEQRAVINRLADEFSSELNSLGVRVSALENKVGNVKITGDARLRYQGAEKEGYISDTNEKKKSQFDYRARFQLDAQVNEDTKIVARLVAGDTEFGDATSNNVTFDRAYVEHKFDSKFVADAGRFGLVVGDGLVFDDTFDGVTASYMGQGITVTAGHGYLTYTKNVTVEDKDVAVKTDNNTTVSLVQAKGEIAKDFTLGAFYLKTNKTENTVFGELDNVYGVALSGMLGEKVWVGGEWTKAKWASDAKNDDNVAWVAGLGYGVFDQAKKGTWDVKVQYFDVDKNSGVISTTSNYTYAPWEDGSKGWMATVDYALAKNVGLTANYIFGVEDKTDASKDLSDRYRVELNYQF